MMSKPFVLGVGAQKAGTAWLHRYLALSGFRRGAVKEWHVWNAIEGSPAIQPHSPKRFPLRDAMIADPSAYFDHFADGGMDITPAYSGLSASTFRTIRDGFAERGVEVRPIFIMRDPVERVWSAWRMHRANGRTMLPLVEYARSPEAKSRGSYELTIAALESAFDRVWFGFHETLFETGHIAMAGYLGVEPLADRGSDRRGHVPKNSDLSPETRSAIAGQYASTYAFCRERFPETVRLWHQDAMFR